MTDGLRDLLMRKISAGQYSEVADTIETMRPDEAALFGMDVFRWFAHEGLLSPAYDLARELRRR